jgi:threonine-phosphate decarboxylase
MKSLINTLPLGTELNEKEGVQNHPMLAPHGGNLTPATLATGLTRQDFLDFSVNINPLGPPDCVQDICSRSIDFLGEYPDPDYGELKKVVADAVGVSTDWIAMGNGSTELIYLLPHLIAPGKEAVIVSPCFSEYERAFRQADISVRHFTLDPSDNFNLPVDQFLFQLRQYPDLGGIVIGSPNNPTGNLLAEDAFRTLSVYCEKRGIFLIVDETFIDFASPQRSFIKHIATARHLILIRSMTKFYSLPGLRLGFAIMNPESVRKLEAHQPPWSVNGLAKAIGMALVMDKKYCEQTRYFIQREKNFLYENLQKISAIEVFPSDANFILFRLLAENEDKAKHFFEAFLFQGIVLRNCANFVGLDHSFFRLAVRSRKDNRLFLSKAGKYFHSISG